MVSTGKLFVKPKGAFFMKGFKLKRGVSKPVGIAVFTVSYFAVNKQCAKNYEKVDL